MGINIYIYYRSPAADVLFEHGDTLRETYEHQVRPGNIYTHLAGQVRPEHFPVFGYTYPSLSEPDIDRGEHICL